MRVRNVLGMLLCALSTACEPPIPVLAKLSSPVLTAQRRMGGPLLVVLSYDTKKTPCGAVEALRAQLDGVAMPGSAGQRIVDKTTGAETCAFPNFSVVPPNVTTPRELIVTDDVTAVSMTLDTLTLGVAFPDSPPATLHTGSMLRWNTSPPAAGTGAWSVTFTPEGGTPVPWVDGTGLPTSISLTVPPVTTSASGTVALSWMVNTAVTKCEGVASCSATIQGAATFLAVVAP